MADETRSSEHEETNPRKERRQPIGGGKIPRKPETGGKAGGEGHTSQQSNADADGPSRQTSTAKDETGQL